MLIPDVHIVTNIAFNHHLNQLYLNYSLTDTIMIDFVKQPFYKSISRLLPSSDKSKKIYDDTDMKIPLWNKIYE